MLRSDNVRLRIIVQLYLSFSKKHPDRILQYMNDQRTLQDAIRAACLSVDREGIPHPHQYGTQKEYLEKWAARVLAEKTAIKAAGSFEELHDILKLVSAHSRGVGRLLVYDTAVRIGVHREIHPKKLYLPAAGTLQGARNLFGEIKTPTLLKSDLPGPLRKLSYEQIENLLCIGKDLLDKNLDDPAFSRLCEEFEERPDHTDGDR